MDKAVWHSMQGWGPSLNPGLTSIVGLQASDLPQANITP